MVNTAPNMINAQATRESSRRSWSAVRGCARLVLGLFLLLVAPVQLGIAVYDQAHHGMGEAVAWPNWTGWVLALCGIGVLSRGAGLRRSGRQKMAEIAEKWAALERQRSEGESVFSTLIGAGHYEVGLTARYEHARAERARVGARIAAHRSPGFFASLSEASGGAEDEILAQMDRLADADAAMMAARDLFAFAPGWRDVWKSEIGPIIEDLDVLDDVADTLESVNTDPGMLAEIEAFRERVGDHKDTVNDLGKCLEDGQVGPAQALEELDRIANECRSRLANVVTTALAADTTAEGRQRYARWQSPPSEVVDASEMFYHGSYLSKGETHEYNPASTIRLTANSAGVNLGAYQANTSGYFEDYNSYIYVRPLYFDDYVTYDTSTSSSTSSAHYGSSSGGFSGSGSSSSF